ncbi:hypothetical protein Dimus_037100, partial [Dionaea muscipula]
ARARGGPSSARRLLQFHLPAHEEDLHARRLHQLRLRRRLLHAELLAHSCPRRGRRSLHCLSRMVARGRKKDDRRQLLLCICVHI